MQKTAAKNTEYSRNETILKIGHHAKAISPCKILTLGQKLKFEKQIHSTNHLKCSCKIIWSCFLTLGQKKAIN